jgi:hypothetical protein
MADRLQSCRQRRRSRLGHRATCGTNCSSNTSSCSHEGERRTSRKEEEEGIKDQINTQHLGGGSPALRAHCGSTEYDRRCPGSHHHHQQRTSRAGKRADAPGSCMRHIHGRGGGRQTETLKGSKVKILSLRYSQQTK